MSHLRMLTTVAALLCLSATLSYADMFSAATSQNAQYLCNRRAAAYEGAKTSCHNVQDCARGLSIAWHLEGEELRLVLGLWADGQDHSKEEIRDACMNEMTGQSY